MCIKFLHNKFIWRGSDFLKKQIFLNFSTFYFIFLSINWICICFMTNVSGYLLNLLPLQLHFPPYCGPLCTLGKAHTSVSIFVKLLHAFFVCVKFWQNWKCKRKEKKKKTECEYLGQELIFGTWSKLHATSFGCRKCSKLWLWVVIYKWKLLSTSTEHICSLNDFSLWKSAEDQISNVPEQWRTSNS